jgi:cerevisin
MHGCSFKAWVLRAAVLLPYVATTSASLLLPVRSTEDAVRKDGYIITFKPSVDVTSAHDQIARQFGSGAVRNLYSSTGFKGLAGTFNSTQIATLESSPLIQSIERDLVGQVDSLVTQLDATWGLQRISQVAAISRPDDQTALDYTYLYDNTAGSGVDIYIIDSGINIYHEDFGGRARWGVVSH